VHPASTVVFCLVNGPRQEDLVQIARECAAATAFAASLNLQLGTVAVHEFTVTIFASPTCTWIFKIATKERFTSYWYGRALLKSCHTPTKHCRFHDLSPYLTLASVSLRLHLSWTLDHVLIPVGRLKNPLLCKAGGRGSGGDMVPSG